MNEIYILSFPAGSCQIYNPYFIETFYLFQHVQTAFGEITVHKPVIVQQPTQHHVTLFLVHVHAWMGGVVVYVL